MSAAPTPPDPAQLLADHDLRVTGQRLLVLGAMVRERNDVTAQTLHERLRRTHPKLGLATVYRTLNVLADAGVLDRLHHDSSTTCYRYCSPGHHHHLTCRVCHTVVELHECDLRPWAHKQGRRHGFRAVEHSVELEGICDACYSVG
jgi:Fur family transcriptional regulator, ferric uptake regulator